MSKEQQGSEISEEKMFSLQAVEISIFEVSA